MITIIRESNPVAKKEHDCDACQFILNEGVNRCGYTISELREIVKARRNAYQIVKGQKYIYQFNTNGNDVWVFKAIPEIHEICLEHDMYED